MKRAAAPCLVFALLIFTTHVAHAQQDSTSLKDVFAQFSLRDLLNVSIVTVSKQEEKIFDAPLASSVLTGDEIKAAGMTSVQEALRLIPGMIVREQTPGNYSIHIRGYDAIDPLGNILQANNTVTLVMINNRIVYNDQNGGTYWDALQVGIDDIDRIEVVRGAASALYGANAATGVINIITKKPYYKRGFYGSTYSITEQGIKSTTTATRWRTRSIMILSLSRGDFGRDPTR
jgi:iron complex outermembrane recepter protein